MSSGTTRPSSGSRSGSADPSGRGRVSQEPVTTGWDAKPRDPYAQFFMQRSNSTAATGTSHGTSAAAMAYYGRGYASGGYEGGHDGYGAASSGGDASARSLFRRNHHVSKPSGSDTSGRRDVALGGEDSGNPYRNGPEQAWGAPSTASRTRPTSAASIRPTSASRGRPGEGSGHQTLADAIAIDATALVNNAAAKVAAYARPSSAAADYTAARCVRSCDWN
jgi:hypothetical protein